MDSGQTNRARKILGLLDLTSLNASDDEKSITRLCARGVTRHGSVAAVCVWPRLVGCAKAALSGTETKVAAVANFPHGACERSSAVREACAIVTAGGNEVDLVFPYNAWLNGRRGEAVGLVRAVKDAIGPTTLKVILETGCLRDLEQIRAASLGIIEAGADFIKTSTGKATMGATLESAGVMLRAIAESGAGCGFKASGGVTRFAIADGYLRLCDRLMGNGWAIPERFRFGASGLLDDLNDVLAGTDASASPSQSRY